MMNENGQQNTRTGPRSPEYLRPTLDTLDSTRSDLANLTRAFLAGDVSEHTYRATVYGVNSITKLLVHAKVSDLEKRIKALERTQ